MNWVLRGFWGKYYQAPPLSTVSGPLLDYAVSQGLGFIPLRGERDQEHQFGLTIPLRGWVVRREQLSSARAELFRSQLDRQLERLLPADHRWRTTVRLGGLDPLAEDCPTRRSLSHVCLRACRRLGRGQRRPDRFLASGAAATSCWTTTKDTRFTRGSTSTFRGESRLAEICTTVPGSPTDPAMCPRIYRRTPLSIFRSARRSAENLTLSVTSLNLANRRFLLDNSATFGGTHYAEPRQIYVQVRYRFHF